MQVRASRDEDMVNSFGSADLWFSGIKNHSRTIYAGVIRLSANTQNGPPRASAPTENAVMVMLIGQVMPDSGGKNVLEYWNIDKSKPIGISYTLVEDLYIITNLQII